MAPTHTYRLGNTGMLLGALLALIGFVFISNADPHMTTGAGPFGRALWGTTCAIPGLIMLFGAALLASSCKVLKCGSCGATVNRD